jgi:hypothetical protein
MESALCASCAFAWRELALLRGWARRAAKDDKEYQTHPRTADGAFVFGFVPSETVFAVNGKGKGKQVEVIDVDVEKEGVSTLLGPAARALGRYHGRGEEEACRRKVWGLRCGHLIDGKCFEELRKPVEEEDPDSGALDAIEERLPSPEPDGKGKGRRRQRLLRKSKSSRTISSTTISPTTSARACGLVLRALARLHAGRLRDRGPPFLPPPEDGPR